MTKPWPRVPGTACAVPGPGDHVEPQPPKFLRMKEVCRRVRLCENSIRKKIKEGTFPAPRKIGVRAIAFLVTEIAAWEAATPPVIWVKKKDR